MAGIGIDSPSEVQHRKRCVSIIVCLETLQVNKPLRMRLQVVVRYSAVWNSDSWWWAVSKSSAWMSQNVFGARWTHATATQLWQRTVSNLINSPAEGSSIQFFFFNFIIDIKSCVSVGAERVESDRISNGLSKNSTNWLFDRTRRSWWLYRIRNE